MLSFADQVSNYAALLADLKVFRFESNKFGPSQSASDEQREDRPITFASEAAVTADHRAGFWIDQRSTSSRSVHLDALRL